MSNHERVIYKGTKEHELYSNPENIHGYSNETTVLPPVWDGKFQKAEQPDLPPLKPGERYVMKGTKDHELLSDASKYHGYNSDPIVHPVAWDGTFAKSNEVFIKPNRNASNADNFFERKSYTTVLPPTWDGTFAKSGETYMKPTRNQSDSRDYK